MIRSLITVSLLLGCLLFSDSAEAHGWKLGSYRSRVVPSYGRPVYRYHSYRNHFLKPVYRTYVPKPVYHKYHAVPIISGRPVYNVPFHY